MRILFITSILACALLSCKKDKVNMQKFWECHQSLGLDSVGMTMRLTGSWTWESRACADDFEKPDRDIVATFNANGSFELRENGAIVDQAGWKIARIGSGGWELQLIYIFPTIPYPYFYGSILFCDNRVMFSHRPLDGCDNLFEKN